MKPVLAQSLLGGLRIYIVTHYSILRRDDDPTKATLVAKRKYDVTNLFEMYRGHICLKENLTLEDQLEVIGPTTLNGKMKARAKRS